MPGSLLFALRYLFALLPFTYVLLAEPALASAFSLQHYWLLFLLFLTSIELRRQFPRFTLIGLILETTIVLWLTYNVSALLSLLWISSLLSSERSDVVTLMRSLLYAGWLAFNIVLFDSDTTWLVLFNLVVGLAISFQWYRLKMETEQQLQRMEYDHLRGHNYELEQARQEMIQFSRMVEMVAQMEERSRIAHDLHDELGHQLVRLKMMMDASVEVIEVKPEESKKLFLIVRDQLSDSMELMRATVQRLKPRQMNTKSYSLKHLIEEYRDAPVAIHYSMSGQPIEMYPSMEITFYRNAKEAIANAIRHGHATIITLHLHFDQRHIVLEVRNNGCIPDHIKLGMGLQGMKDRAETLGGKVEVATAPEVTVRTELPIL